MDSEIVDEDEYSEEVESPAEQTWRLENGYGRDDMWFEDLLLRGDCYS